MNATLKLLLFLSLHFLYVTLALLIPPSAQLSSSDYNTNPILSAKASLPIYKRQEKSSSASSSAVPFLFIIILLAGVAIRAYKFYIIRSNNSSASLDQPRIVNLTQSATLGLNPEFGANSPDQHKNSHLTVGELNKYPVSALQDAVKIAIAKISDNEHTGIVTPVSNKSPDDLEKNQHDGIEYECSFCLEKITSSDIVRVIPCLHFYHLGCLDQWLLNFSHSCPSCRFDLHTDTDKL
ncbi:hypothetical protein BB561_000497 [Smittium simulii]|uniref:RING-type domain-containing protein n=1 Tax=Smittium simulii TaxID=133385 RepID=A0A2T9YYX5_9FUNG|nr:hypothetical protein BB561_000497 [Smittium simulii]